MVAFFKDKTYIFHSLAITANDKAQKKYAFLCLVLRKENNENIFY